MLKYQSTNVSCQFRKKKMLKYQSTNVSYSGWVVKIFFEVKC